MDRQTTGAVLLVRPAAFGFNAEAAKSNAFATASADPELERKALGEFDALRTRLSDAGVDILVLDDTADPPKPDAVFPNNWVSLHADGTMVLYPMATAARRAERRPDDLKALLEERGFEVRRTIDLGGHEHEGGFLEGTGSLVLDRPNRRAFASRSPRTDARPIAEFDRAMGYETHLFDAFDPEGRPIYHSNVLMSLGTRFAVLCADAVAAGYREPLKRRIEDSGRELIEVEFGQLSGFVCNVIELGSSNGPVIAMSVAARNGFRPDQLRMLERFGEIVDAPVPTIEEVGGGSVRCMIAEIHLPRSKSSLRGA
ncbi:MAG TPA: arginine deiminase-related protein [Sphingomicrobium sp.]|nr:arginine deiminase-related protein [Sphingomicrobium sp.]